MKKTIVVFEQTLRLHDNPALWHAASRGEVIPVFVLDTQAPAEYRLGGASKWWLHHSLTSLQSDLEIYGVKLILRRSDMAETILKLAKESDASAVYWNRCYEPHNILKYKTLKARLGENNIEAMSFKGSVLFEPWEILNQQGQYFKVFTPFWNCCLKKGEVGEAYGLPALHKTTKQYNSDALGDWKLLPRNPDWATGFKEIWKPGEAHAYKNLTAFIKQRLDHYATRRDFPSDSMTSYLSPHLHWGEISPRQVWQATRQYEMMGGSGKMAGKFLSELGWREFSYYLLYHFPSLPSAPFSQKFTGFAWADDPKGLSAWQRGQTGYPIVDAGMRELWHTGYMHNRVRMIAASFLTKDLRIAWQEGARWFWDTLVDADLASNSASWQWVAGCGADAAPYFRIFNPVLQGEKFDPSGQYVRRWVPELSRLADSDIHSPWKADKATLKTAGVILGESYPLPVVDHSQARDIALKAYKTMRSS